MGSMNENSGQSRQALILDTSRESLRNTAFLLRLTGLEVSMVEDETEALDWILKRKDSQSPFRLLILSNANRSVEARRMLEHLDNSGAALPILIVERSPADRELAASCTGGRYSRPILACTPMNIHESVRSLLQLCKTEQQ